MDEEELLKVVEKGESERVEFKKSTAQMECHMTSTLIVAHLSYAFTILLVDCVKLYIQVWL